MIPKELDFQNIKEIYEKLTPFIKNTPIVHATKSIQKIFNTNLFLKLEFFQNSGTFKARGVVNNILNLTKEQKILGVTAASAGNHAIATSYGANIFGIKSKVFMYDSANSFRINRVKSYNSKLVLSKITDAFKDMLKASKEEGYTVIHPFDGIKTIQGTASLGFEISNQIKELDNIIISVGGGGLISGVGSIIRQKFPKCKIIGVEPEGAKGLTESLKIGKPVSSIQINTIADSLSAPFHLPFSFSICQNVVDQMVLVTDLQMKKAMKFMGENCKLILEPAGVAGIAALQGPLKDKLKNQTTVIILCGANIDMHSWINLTNIS